MQTNRLGCLTGTGIIAALITVLILAVYAYTSGGLMFNPGLLSAKSGEALGGVTSHAEIKGNCKACHTAPWESEKMADRCAACHGEIASEMQSIASMHGRMMHDNPDLSCRHCHPDHRGADAPLTVLDKATFPHEVVGYSLNGHQFTATREAFTCDDCHQGDISTFASDSCQTCHSQIDSAFAQTHSTDYGNTCLDCHDGVDRFGKSFKHDFTFQLTGKHVDVTCAKCHTGVRTVADFSSAPTECTTCHQKDEPHEGRFGTDCATCHTADAWTPAKFDHTLAVFKLEGEHQEVDCESCHQDNIYKGTPSECYACHQKDDEHNGTFGTDCSACHQPSNWDAVTFDHNKSNFPLTGRHNGLACEQCHTNNQFTGLLTACVTCHADPIFHVGMFTTDCASCHTTNDWFAKYTGPHPAIADEGGSGVSHGGGTCRDCHTQNLSTATCTACHDNNNPDGDGGEGEGGDD